MSAKLSKKILVFQTPEELEIALKHLTVSLSDGDVEKGMNILNIVKALMVSYHGLLENGVKVQQYRFSSDDDEAEAKIVAEMRDRWRAATKEFCEHLELTFDKKWFKNNG